jgi:hypothetical protein
VSHFAHGLAHASFGKSVASVTLLCVSHGAVVYVPTWYPSCSCVKLDGEVRKAGHLADLHQILRTAVIWAGGELTTVMPGA